MSPLKFEIIALTTTVEKQPVTNEQPGDALIMGCGGGSGGDPVLVLPDNPDDPCFPSGCLVMNF